MIHFDIENFQSIKHLDFKVKGFTVIVGKTNIGKSAIIRSIKSALRNNRGNFYIRKGSKKCQLSLKDQEKVDIQWDKGKGNNYKINGVPFTNVGLSVPSEISDLGFRTIPVGNKELDPQIADQFNPLFLIDGKGGSTAEVLFDISRIKVLNEAQRLVEKDQRDSKSLLKTRVSDLSGIKGEIDKLKGITKVREGFESLQSEDKEISDLKSETIEISGFITTVSQKSSEIKILLEVEKTEIPEISLDTLFEDYISIHKLSISFDQHFGSVSKLKSLDELTVPEMNLDNDFSGLIEIQKNCVVYEQHLKAISLIEGIEDVSVPEMNLDNDFSELIELQKNCAVYEQHLKAISLIEGIEDVSVPEESQIDFEEIVWARSMIDTLINIKNNLDNEKDLESTYTESISKINAEIEEVKEKLGVCPLCERSL